MKHQTRLFVAAPLPDQLTAVLETYLAPYEHPDVRIVPTQNWHLTIHFIGNVPNTKVAEISSRLKELLSGFEPFTLKLLRVAPGPNARTPRLVWAMFAENKTFEKLVRKVTIGLGAKMENQHPLPHITLARFAKDLPRPPKLPVTPAATSTVFEVTELALWQSELGSTHPKYSILETFAAGSGKNPNPEQSLHV